MRRIIKLDSILLTILATQALINLVGALGPELSFDALWYHLTLPKLFIEQGRIFIPGNLLYYSAMPKLIELFYIPAIFIGGEILAKIVHFSFGIGTLVVLYKLSRIFFSKTGSLLVLVVFYSNMVVAWQSMTAYIDLGRTFFEVLALYFLVSYFRTKESPAALIKSSICVGLAISSKLLAVGSLLIFLAILILNEIKISKIVQFITISLLIPMPWFAFAYINTGNPFYPLFSDIYKVSPSINIFNIVNLVRSSDPISPIYLIMLPIIIIAYRKFDKLTKIICVYSILSFFLWSITPQTGGGRFIMPYLPAFSILVVAAINSIKNTIVTRCIITLILLVSLTSIVYRGLANMKYLPAIIGYESRHEFLSRNLNFDFGDFYDTDQFFENNIKRNDNVLIYGTHNLYYVEFPYVHESWRKASDRFNYVMTQNTELPKEFSSWKEVYSNETTHVKLYSKNERID